MKKFVSFALSFFFGAWLLYQGAYMIQEVYLFLILLAGGLVSAYSLVKYWLHRKHWRS